MPQLIKPALKVLGNECDLTLYQLNKSEQRPSFVTQIPFSKWTGCKVNDIVSSPWTAHKVNDVICDYFKVDEEWDKNLLKSVFIKNRTYDQRFDCFEFETTNKKIFGVSVYGNKDLICLKDSPEFYIVRDQVSSDKELLVSMEKFDENGSILINKNSTLSFEAWHCYNYRNYSAAALFNSRCFKRLTSYSTSLRLSRTLVKIELR